MLEVLKIKFLDPLKEFIHDSRSIGITLLTCTILSLCLANLDLSGEVYRSFWNMHWAAEGEHHFALGPLHLPGSLLLIINDFLMAIFFLLAGMEIKRELIQGELSSMQKAILPIAAAIGGMLAPALLYSFFNKGSAEMQGWAIPTATDIAFSLGVASLLAKRVPLGLKVFLTALAIIDDLGAIVVIALFYGGSVQLMYLLGAALFGLGLYLHNRFPKAPVFLRYVFALGVWYCMFNSGVHATVAGVIVAFLMPVKRLVRLELKLHTPVYFVIVPIFALANTAILLPENSLQALSGHLSWGILIGLIVGKPLGICVAAYLLISRKWASLPAGTSWYQLMGAGLLAGIGFTMSIFISTLAFTDAERQDIAKISVLLASFIAMILGYVWLKMGRPVETKEEAV
jgi:NhaA family Na+:H+ antiporter